MTGPSSSTPTPDAPVAPLRIGILVVAYNAAATLHRVLDRIPEELRPRIHEILVSDDASQDATHLVALGYQGQSPLPLTVVRQPENLGYGGNQKVGYQWAVDHGWDVVVLLHGDGQYAPEMLAELVAPIEAGEADAVMGSRMMAKGGARRGGMPLYKFVGNRILTTAQNALVGTHLSEWHSGYRAYRVEALAGIDFADDSDGFDFDTEILVQLHHAGARIAEVPIPTYYGDEISHVNGMRYAADVIGHVARYRLASMGFGVDTVPGTEPDRYEAKHEEGTSHVQLLAWLADRRPGRVLDLGCADGSLGAAARRMGHTVTGVDLEVSDEARHALDEAVSADLDAGLPDDLGGGWDVILAADVLEHLRRPDLMLEALSDRLAPGGVLLVSVPNVGHWYPRLRILAGRFDYDRRGILDAGHLRFFTRASLERLLGRTGWVVRRRTAVGLPLEVAERGTGEAGAGGDDEHAGGLGELVRSLDRAAVALRPTLFGYQLLYELSPASATSRSQSPPEATVVSATPSSPAEAGDPAPNQAHSSSSP